MKRAVDLRNAPIQFKGNRPIIPEGFMRAIKQSGTFEGLKSSPEGVWLYSGMWEGDDEDSTYIVRDPNYRSNPEIVEAEALEARAKDLRRLIELRNDIKAVKEEVRVREAQEREMTARLFPGQPPELKGSVTADCATNFQPGDEVRVSEEWFTTNAEDLLPNQKRDCSKYARAKIKGVSDRGIEVHFFHEDGYLIDYWDISSKNLHMVKKVTE